MPKKIIERNIKNSITIRIIINVRVKPTEKVPVIMVERMNFIVSKNVGDMNKMNSDIIKQAKPQIISINAVKYFEFKS